MGLECLLVTCDPILLGQIKSTFSAHASSLELRQDSVSALELAGRRHFGLLPPVAFGSALKQMVVEQILLRPARLLEPRVIKL